jgi:hypothetical protein
MFSYVRCESSLDEDRNVFLAEEWEAVEAGDISCSALDVECDAVLPWRRVVGFGVKPDWKFRSEYLA